MNDHDPSTSQNIKYPHWQREFEAALIEADLPKLRQRVDAAEADAAGVEQRRAGSRDFRQSAVCRLEGHVGRRANLVQRLQWIRLDAATNRPRRRD